MLFDGVSGLHVEAFIVWVVFWGYDLVDVLALDGEYFDEGLVLDAHFILHVLDDIGVTVQIQI